MDQVDQILASLSPEELAAFDLELFGESEEAKLRRWQGDPVAFARERLKIPFLWDQQEIIARALLEPPYRVMVKSGHKVGKAQPVDMVIDTPAGRRRFGDLRVGDEVFGVDGRPVRVTGVFPQGRRPCFRVHLDDGTSTLADADHLWTVQSRQGRRPGSKGRGQWQTLTTAQLAAAGLKRPNGRHEARNWELPRVRPVEYPGRPVPVPGYTLGVWLGDGTVGTSSVTSADPEISNALSEGGAEVRVHAAPTSGRGRRVLVRGLSRKLAALGILKTATHEKRVPRLYLENAPAVRLAVLQGLMDTDGTVGKGGKATFCSVSRGLVEDVAWLVRSLGGRASVHPTVKRAWYRGREGERIDCRPAYVVSVAIPGMDLFRLERKRRRLSETTTRAGRRWLDRIEPEGHAEMQCISVDAADSLYLCNDFIPTHNTFLLAWLINWWFECFPDGVVISTAPTFESLCDTVWTEVRIQRQMAGLDMGVFIGPSAPEMRTGPDHFAKGISTNRPEAFHGRHRSRMLFVIDEAGGVPAPFWRIIRTMFKPEEGHAWISTLNPVDVTCHAYQEDNYGAWRTFTLSSLEHPNIVYGLAGERPPIPNAVTIPQIDEWVRDWCEPIPADHATPTDFEWPPGSGDWFRPGPEFDARCRGLWPSQGTYGIWSDALWQLCVTGDHASRMIVPLDAIPEIGCDPARFGDDYTTMHVRWGNTSFYHQAVNGWRLTHTAGRLIELANEWSGPADGSTPDGHATCNSVRKRLKMAPIRAKDIPLKIDADGLGSGVVDIVIEKEYKGLPMHFGGSPYSKSRFPNKRSEIWFNVAEKAMAGGVWLARLPREHQQKIRAEFMAPRFSLDSAGRRVVEKKEVTKEKLGRSPDNADGVNLAYADTMLWEAPSIIQAPENRRIDVLQSRARKRGLFGRY